MLQFAKQYFKFVWDWRFILLVIFLFLGAARGCTQPIWTDDENNIQSSPATIVRMDEVMIITCGEAIITFFPYEGNWVSLDGTYIVPVFWQNSNWVVGGMLFSFYKENDAITKYFAYLQFSEKFPVGDIPKQIMKSKADEFRIQKWN